MSKGPYKGKPKVFDEQQQKVANKIMEVLKNAMAPLFVSDIAKQTGLATDMEKRKRQQYFQNIIDVLCRKEEVEIVKIEYGVGRPSTAYKLKEPKLEEDKVELCVYGCGRKATVWTRDLKAYRCRKEKKSCPAIKAKKKASAPKNETGELCVHGCGQVGTVWNEWKNGFQCAESSNSCPEVKARKSLGDIPKEEIDSGQKCCFGCGQPGRFWNERGQGYMCQPKAGSCPINSAKISEQLTGKERKGEYVEESNHFCDYGCGRIGKWRLVGAGTVEESEKWCCEPYYQACPAAIERRSSQMIEKYEDPGAKKQFLDRQFETNGGMWAAQRPGVAEKIQISGEKSKYKFKEYRMPSGRIVEIQGFGPYALDDLLKIYAEDDLLIEYKCPRIKTSVNITSWRPDIFVKSVNLVVDVKSVYTYMMHLVKNKIKKKDAKKLGYEVLFMIYEKKGILLSEEEAESRYEIVGNHVRLKENAPSQTAKEQISN